MILFSLLLLVKHWSSQEIIQLVDPSERGFLHHSFLQYVLQVAQDVSLDENTRCKKFLSMIRDQVSDEPSCSTGRFSNSINSLVDRTYKILQKIRMATPGIQNAKHYLEKQISNLLKISDDEKFRAYFIETIDMFIKEKIDDVADHISRIVSDSINQNEVILTYDYSSIMLSHQLIQ
jgi:translation initiation factor eIF-2B subunit delta